MNEMYDIKITGEGTRENFAHALRELANSITDEDIISFEDPVLMCELTQY